MIDGGRSHGNDLRPYLGSTICTLTLVGGMLRAKSKAFDAVGEGERVGDQRLDVDLAAAHRDRARVDVGVAEDVLDAGLLDLRRDHVVVDRVARHADEDDAPAGAERIEHFRRGTLVAAGLEDEVGAPAVGHLHDRIGHLLAADVDARHAPSLRGELELGLLHVADEHARATAGECCEGADHADRPGADDDRDVARRDLGLVRGVHADRERLDHRAGGVGDVVGQAEGEVGRVDHRRAQARRAPAGSPRSALPGRGCTCRGARRCWSGRGCRAPCRPGRRLQARGPRCRSRRSRRPLRGPKSSAHRPRTGRCGRGCSSGRRLPQTPTVGSAMRTSRGPSGSSTAMSRSESSSFRSSTSASMAKPPQIGRWCQP